MYMVLPSGINAQHVGTFWMLPLDATTTGNVVPRVPATFQRIGPEATPLLTQAMERNDPAEVYQRFATGRCCYVALVDGTLLAGFTEASLGTPALVLSGSERDGRSLARKLDDGRGW